MDAYAVTYSTMQDADLRTSDTFTVDEAISMARRLLTDPAWGSVVSVTITLSGKQVDERPLSEIEANIIS